MVEKFLCLNDLSLLLEIPNPKRLADQTKGSSLDGNFRPIQTVLKAVASKQSRRRASLGANPLAVGLDCKIMRCCLKRFFMLPWASHRLKNFVFKYEAKVSKTTRQQINIGIPHGIVPSTTLLNIYTSYSTMSSQNI